MTNTPKLEMGVLINGRYRVDGFLGKGGMAEVYRGTDTNIDRAVAIKILNLPQVDLDEEMRQGLFQRFHREAKAAARIRHPNVVNIYDFGVADALAEPFIVMELLEGHDLQSELSAQGAMEPARVLALFDSTLDALALAHKAGVVHKDLKPENLFLESIGQPGEILRIVDFGVAHIYDDQQGRLTQAGDMFSTPEYLAPEYVNHGLVAPTFDVYQMGLIIAECLAGQPIVRAENPYQCAVMHGIGKIALPQSLLDGPLGPVLQKTLALDHEERFQDAGALLAALRAVDSTSVVAPRRGEPWISLLTGAPVKVAAVAGLDPAPGLLTSSPVVPAIDAPTPVTPLETRPVEVQRVVERVSLGSPTALASSTTRGVMPLEVDRSATRGPGISPSVEVTIDRPEPETAPIPTDKDATSSARPTAHRSTAILLGAVAAGILLVILAIVVVWVSFAADGDSDQIAADQARNAERQALSAAKASRDQDAPSKKVAGTAEEEGVTVPSVDPTVVRPPVEPPPATSPETSSPRSTPRPAPTASPTPRATRPRTARPRSRSPKTTSAPKAKKGRSKRKSKRRSTNKQLKKLKKTLKKWRVNTD